MLTVVLDSTTAFHRWDECVERIFRSLDVSLVWKGFSRDVDSYFVSSIQGYLVEGIS